MLLFGFVLCVLEIVGVKEIVIKVANLSGGITQWFAGNVWCGCKFCYSKLADSSKI